jgi:hypothetical protein
MDDATAEIAADANTTATNNESTVFACEQHHHQNIH